MASTYTTNLGIEKIATGEKAGTWGDTTNTNFDIIDEAINGVVAVTLTSSHTTSGGALSLPITDGASSNGRNFFIELTDGGDIGGTGFVQLTPSDAEKIAIIKNSLSGSQNALVFQGTYDAARDLQIDNGTTVIVKFPGTGSTTTVTEVLLKGASVTGNAATATALQTARAIAVAGDVVGTADFDGTAGISISTTIQANSVALGTDTTGNYVASLVAGTGVTLSNNSGEGATPTVAIGQAVATSSDVQFDSFGVGTAASGTTGEIRATNNITAYYSSDARLKENINYIDDALGKVAKIQGVEFDWKEDYIAKAGGEDGYFVRKHDVGLIAQQVENVLPELVANRDDGFKAMKYDRVVALLVNAIHELTDRVEELEAQVEV
tara:strand:- start:1656 stop:2795 length:1140 start_codon:yes stop_codon:yes gene_type:complete